MIEVSADLWAFEGALRTSATKDLYERWEKKAKASLANEARLGNLRVREVLKAFEKGEKP